jgi:hypothetical protein
MPLRSLELPGGPPSGLVAVPTDQPRAVVAVDEAGHGLAQLVDGVVRLGPRALLLGRADPALGAAIGLRLTKNAASSAMPSQELEPVKWPSGPGSPSCRSARPRATSASRRPQRSTTASSTGCTRGEAVAGLGRVRPRLGAGVVHHQNAHTQPSVLVQAVVASVPQRWFGPSGMTVPSCGRGRRRPDSSWANDPRAGAAAELVAADPDAVLATQPGPDLAVALASERRGDQHPVDQP